MSYFVLLKLTSKNIPIFKKVLKFNIALFLAYRITTQLFVQYIIKYLYKKM